MRLLAIDTSLEACAVGVEPGTGAPPVIRSETIGRGHGERLLPMVRMALGEAGLRPRDVDRIAVTVGPGSFTGIRIGVAAARGLALVTGAEIVGVTTLAAHAETARGSLAGCPLLCVIEARLDEVNGQLFGADFSPLTEPEVGSAASFAARLTGIDVVLAGSAADAVAAHLGPEGKRWIAHRLSAPDMAAVMRRGASAPIGPNLPRPLYLRPADARPQAEKGARPGLEVVERG